MSSFVVFVVVVVWSRLVELPVFANPALSSSIPFGVVAVVVVAAVAAVSSFEIAVIASDIIVESFDWSLYPLEMPPI